MVEVFKTNVTDELKAQQLLDQFHNEFRTFKANFDLEDCDKILRVEGECFESRIPLLLQFLHKAGIQAEVLQSKILNSIAFNNQ